MTNKHKQTAESKKPFFPRDIRRTAYIPPFGFSPNTTYGYRLQNTDGGTVCWKLGSELAEDLVAHRQLADVNNDVFLSSKVKVFFPIVPAKKGDNEEEPYFATKTLTINGSPTLLRILKAVETTARHAVANHLLVDHQKKSVTLDDVHTYLQQHNAIVCHLLFRRVGGGNHVVVRLTDM